MESDTDNAENDTPYHYNSDNSPLSSPAHSPAGLPAGLPASPAYNSLESPEHHGYDDDSIDLTNTTDDDTDDDRDEWETQLNSDYCGDECQTQLDSDYCQTELPPLDDECQTELPPLDEYARFVRSDDSQLPTLFKMFAPEKYYRVRWKVYVFIHDTLETYPIDQKFDATCSFIIHLLEITKKEEYLYDCIGKDCVIFGNTVYEMIQHMKSVENVRRNPVRLATLGVRPYKK